MMKKIKKRALSLVLVFVMLCLPMTAWAEAGDTTVLWEGADFAITENYTYVCESGDLKYDGLIYESTGYGTLTVDVSKADPGWHCVIVDTATYEQVEGDSSSVSSLSMSVYPDCTYAIQLTTYDATIVEGMWGSYPVGPSTGTLSYKVTVTETAAPEPGETSKSAIAIDGEETVSIEAGETVWYKYQTDSYTYHDLDIESTVTNFSVYDNFSEASYTDSNGKVEAMPMSDGSGSVVFSITNNSDSANSYVISVIKTVGVSGNGEKISGEGSYEAEMIFSSYGYSMGYYYAWTAETDGVVTVTMTGSNWQYCVGESDTHSFDGDYNYETGETEPAVPSESVQVKAGDVVDIFVKAYDGNDYPDSTVSFKVEFEAGATLEGNGGEGDEPTGPVTVEYENQATPEKFEFVLDEEDELSKVNVLDGVVETAVLGTDGYYHLNSADGPVLMVMLGEKAPYNVSLAAIAAEGRLYVSEYDDSWNLIKRTYYNEAVKEYVACMDANYGLYPLTVDLMEVYQVYGESAYWYENINGLPTSIFGEEAEADENAWMFACYYVEGMNSIGGTTDGTTGGTTGGTTAGTPSGVTTTSPDTGDNANVAVWAIVMVVAAGAAFVVAESKRRAR